MNAANRLLRRLQPRVLALAAAPLVLLAPAHLLPATGVGAGVRLAAAGFVVLVLPGALILHALRWPKTLGAVLAGSFLLSLGVAAVALGAAFALDRNFSFGLAVGAAITLVAFLCAAFSEPVEFERSDLLAGLAVAAAAVPVAVPIWLTHNVLAGDDLFHLGRMVKLTELPALTSLSAVGEFADAGLHPGYTFPLWQAVVAAVGEVAGVSGETAVLHLGQALAPLGCVIAYGLGRALFSSWAGGVATAAAQATLWAYQGRAGAMRTLSDPETAARSVVAVSIVLLVVVYLDDRRHRLLLPIGVGGLALAVIHPNYPLYLLLPLLGFLLADLVVNRTPKTTRLLTVASAAIAVPAAVFVLAMWPVISNDVGQQRAAYSEFENYVADYDGSYASFHVAPGAITRTGGSTVAGLLGLPLVALCARRRWGAFAAGGSLLVLLVLLTPALFVPFAHAVSLAQARRLIVFLPLAVALAGLSVLAARWRAAAVVAAGVAGTALALAYPGRWAGVERAPGWPVWVALAGGLGALAFAAWRRPEPPAPTAWAAAVGVGLVLPLLVSFLVRVDRANPDPLEMPPSLVAELRALPPGATVFANPTVSFRILAEAPLYVASAPPLHVARTSENRVFERVVEARRFFSAQTSPERRRAILTASRAGWLLVYRQQERLGPISGPLRCVYSDARFQLFRVEPGSSAPAVPHCS